VEDENDWDPWAVAVQQHQLQQPQVQDLNLAPQQVMEIDLNAPVVDGDINPQEVIINPPHPLPGGDFLELNDFL